MIIQITRLHLHPFLRPVVGIISSVNGSEDPNYILDDIQQTFLATVAMQQMSRKEVDLDPRLCSELFQAVSLRLLEFSDSRVRQDNV